MRDFVVVSYATPDLYCVRSRPTLPHGQGLDVRLSLAVVLCTIRGQYDFSSVLPQFRGSGVEARFRSTSSLLLPQT
ncbi:hypothetical protein TNCV_3496551 [Trichonephila clavipes]|nr:hypothetical protein TNCV_3496551 [Trichonephila clavipes]